MQRFYINLPDNTVSIWEPMAKVDDRTAMALAAVEAVRLGGVLRFAPPTEQRAALIQELKAIETHLVQVNALAVQLDYAPLAVSSRSSLENVHETITTLEGDAWAPTPTQTQTGVSR